MPQPRRFRPDDVVAFTDPTTGSGEVRIWEDGLGQDGGPFVLLVEDPPHKTRPMHHHHGDILYLYIKGEHHIEGEGTYRAGDVRWVPGGHAYGPEVTGPDGGAWWVLSYTDPLPIDHLDESGAPIMSTTSTPEGAPAQPVVSQTPDIPHFATPYDWAAIDAAVRLRGAAVVEGLMSEELAARTNAEIDTWLRDHDGQALPHSGSVLYDAFLGHRTLRLHGLVEKLPSAGPDLVGHPQITAWAERMLSARCATIQLNAGELIEIGPGEPAQFQHRDSDSWPHLPVTESPVIVNAIVALSDFTVENGATNVALDSVLWDPSRRAKPEEMSHAEMRAGDVLLFRGDAHHGGGANTTTDESRRAVSLSYVVGWLRPVENHYLNVPASTVARQERSVQRLLGYEAHDATTRGGGFVGLYENGDPHTFLESV